MDKDEVIKKFGFDPESIGLRHRGWWIVWKLDESEYMADVETGWLAVKARDGASNPPDPDAFRKSNYKVTLEDDFDCTYRYYYFSPLEVEKED